MDRPRVIVGFNASDAHYFELMQAWEKSGAFDFEFCTCHLGSAIGETETTIKRICRSRIRQGSSFLLLISATTRSDRYAQWEAEVALEKECNIIGVNLDGSRTMDPAKCPAVIQNIGALFVPFSPQIIAYAVKHPHHRMLGDWTFTDVVYRQLGYIFAGTLAQCARGADPRPGASLKSIDARAIHTRRMSSPRTQTPASRAARSRPR
jgi:hypothetical protein